MPTSQPSREPLGEPLLEPLGEPLREPLGEPLGEPLRGRTTVARLLLDDLPVSEIEVARTFRDRSRGLLRRDGIATGMALVPASSVHTLGMRFAIDVAYVGREGRVLAVTTMPPGRLGLPRLRARWVLESEAGRMAAWGVARGRRLVIEES